MAMKHLTRAHGEQGFDQDNAVIELNSLKIAEDRSFAEVARYVFITILGACFQLGLALTLRVWIRVTALGLIPILGARHSSQIPSVTHMTPCILAAGVA